MADEQNDAERTEDPTQKRLDEALSRGDVFTSQVVSAWFVIAGATLVLAALANTMSATLSTTMRRLLANAHQIPVDGRGLVSIAGRISGEVLSAIGIPLSLLVLAAIAGNM